MLKAGADFATISRSLGHASLDATVKADVDRKRQALL
ncbi:hypothetical protein [Paraburkholderia sediminicola]